jgi:hypothetical protein
MNYKEYLKQLSIVIFGILIAFWINNVSMYYQERSTQKQVLLTMLNELKDNNESVRANIENLNSLQATLTELKELKNSADPNSNSIFLDYRSTGLNSIGYETAKYTGVLKDVNHRMVSNIVDSYESQIAINEWQKYIKDEILGLFKNGSDENLQYIQIQIHSLIENLEILEFKQQTLIDELSVYLKVKS